MNRTIQVVGDHRHPLKLGALAQFRREVRAGLRQEHTPTDTLWEAAWRELAACWRMAERPDAAAQLERDAAGVIADAAAQKVTT